MWTKVLAATTATLLISALSACKIEGDDDSGALTYKAGDDFLKVAVNHIGANCDIEGATADPSHYLNGPNGELMLEQAKHLDRGSYGFSGDAVMGRTSASAVTKMEDIEAKCRRLILSVDVEEGKYPSIEMTDVLGIDKKKAKFEADFGKNEYGKVDCMSDTEKSLCTFANIEGKNGKKRWFTYLEPNNDTKSVEGTVKIFIYHEMGSDGDPTASYPITLKGIYREKTELSAELQAYFKTSCLDKIGHGGSLSFTPSNETNHNVYGRTYPGRFYTFRYISTPTCENRLYGLEDPQVVQYLKSCNASCTKKGIGSIRFALRFTQHDLTMDCVDDTIGFHVEGNRLHWKEKEGNGTASGWYNCNSGEWDSKIDGDGSRSTPQDTSSDDKVTPRGDDVPS